MGAAPRTSTLSPAPMTARRLGARHSPQAPASLPPRNSDNFDYPPLPPLPPVRRPRPPPLSRRQQEDLLIQQQARMLLQQRPPPQQPQLPTPKRQLQLPAPKGDPNKVDKGLSLLEWTGKLLPQGQLVAAVKAGWRFAWQTLVKELAPQTKKGQYARPKYTFGGRIGTQQFPAESGRYVVYVGNACPWCHRVLLALVLRGLAVLHVAVVRLEDDPTRARRGGWVFGPRNPDPVFGAKDLWQVYDTVSPGFKGRCTAPLLVDARGRQAVCNESSDIVAMINDLNLPGSSPVDLRPRALRKEIDELNQEIYASINNGVYRSGFATSQAAYDEAQGELWAALDRMEERLANNRFLHGEKLTESDVWLWPTIMRLDVSYGPLFRCNRWRIFGSRASPGDYPYLADWARDIYQMTIPGAVMSVRDTIDVNASRRSYFQNLFPLNPSGIVPWGPTADDLRLDAPHGRGPSGLEACFHLRDD